MKNRTLKFVLLVVLLVPWVVHAQTAVSKPANVIQNYSKVRGLHFVLRSISLERAYWMVDLAAESGYNLISALLTHGIQLDNAPWIAQDTAWSKEEFSEWVKHIRNKGMDFVPELKLLSKQEKFFQKRYPRLMFNSRTYNPDNQRVYEVWVYPLIDELHDLLSLKAIHIGHDEIIYSNKLGKGESILPGEKFTEDVIRLNDYLNNKKIETWMWGDMLIAADEFPTMEHHHFHGGRPGYGKTLRDNLPRNLVILDWHYFGKHADFPSLSSLQNEGFRVIGATWHNMDHNQRFSTYASKHNAYGMMATTWWHVQKKEWEIVENIIKKSGSMLLADFPEVILP